MEYQKISELTFAEYNPREISKHDFKALVNSLKEFGFVEPVVINKDNTIIGGHMRVRAAKELGMTEVPVVQVDISKEKEKALNLALNRIHGDWDEQKLAEIIYELKDTDEIDLTGFEDDEISKLLDSVAGTGEEDDFDVDEALEGEAICKLGDLWQLGDHRLYCGDATKIEDVEKLMGGQKVDCLMTDPPYGVDYASKNEFLNNLDEGNRIQKDIENDAIEDYRGWFASWLSNIEFADYNTFYIWMSSKELHNLRLAIEDTGCVWGDYLVWVKNNHVLGRKDYNSKHEFCVYGWKNKHKFYSGHRTTILEFNKPLKSELHPTQKPVAMLQELIKDGSFREAVVLDLFGGSGSTLIACEQLERKCYMMELDPKYCDVIIKRWEQFTGKKAVKL